MKIKGEKLKPDKKLILARNTNFSCDKIDFPCTFWEEKELFLKVFFLYNLI